LDLREEVVGGWRRLHQGDKIKENNMGGWAGHVARTGTMRNPYKVLVGKAEIKRPTLEP
jgi:hypothetical protein